MGKRESCMLGASSLEGPLLGIGQFQKGPRASFPGGSAATVTPCGHKLEPQARGPAGRAGRPRASWSLEALGHSRRRVTRGGLLIGHKRAWATMGN